MKRLKRAVWFLAVAIIAYGAYYLVWGNDRAQTQSLLSWAQLGPLPGSATNIAYHRWSGLFTGETYVKFQLSTEDLQGLIAKVSVLPDWKSEIFGPSHQLRPSSEQDAQGREVINHAYFNLDNFPSWFDMSVRNKGRRFTHVYGSHAWIVVNEENNTVYLWVVKG